MLTDLERYTASATLCRCLMLSVQASMWSVFTLLYQDPLVPQILVQPILYGTVIPLVSYFTFKKLILDPMEERRKMKEKEKQVEADREKVSISVLAYYHC